MMASLTTLLLAGCAHSLIVVNAGIGNKTAAAMGAPFDAKAFCAALTRQGFTIKIKPIKGQEASMTADDANALCQEIVTEQLGDRVKVSVENDK